MGTIKREIGIGILVSVFTTCATLFLYLDYFSQYEFYETIALIKKEKLYGKVIALASIPNLFVFFVYVKKRQDYRARGVLITTISVTLLTFVLRFI